MTGGERPSRRSDATEETSGSRRARSVGQLLASWTRGTRTPPAPVQPPGATPPVEYVQRDHAARRPLVLLFSGMTGNRQQWDLLLPELSGLACDIAHAAPLLPLSDRTKSPRRIEAVAAEIAAELKLLDHNRVVVVGHSVGSFVALAVAAAIPELVVYALLVNGGLIGVAEFLDAPLRVLRRDRRLAVAATCQFAVSGAPAPRWVPRIISGYELPTRLLARGLVSRVALRRPEVRVRLALESRGPALLRALVANRHYVLEVGPTWGKVACPVCIVAGDLDELATEAQSLRMSAMLPSAVVRVLDGVAHAAPLEDPGRVAGFLLGALA